MWSHNFHITSQEKLQSSQLSDVKQIAEDEGLGQKLLWKEPGALLTLDGDAFCAGFTHFFSLFWTFWLKTNIFYHFLLG